MPSEEEKARAHRRMTRAVCAVGRAVVIPTMVIGTYLGVTERNWYVLALGTWAAASIESLARSSRRNPEGDPSSGTAPDAAGR